MGSDDSPSARPRAAAPRLHALGPRHGRRPHLPARQRGVRPRSDVRGSALSTCWAGSPSVLRPRRRGSSRWRGPPHPAHRHSGPRARRVRAHARRPLRRGAGDGASSTARLLRGHRGRRPGARRDRRGLPAARLDRRAAARGDRDPRARRRARRRVRRRRRRLQRRHDLRARPLDRRPRPRRRRPGRRRRDLPLQARGDGRGRVRGRAHAGHAEVPDTPEAGDAWASCWRR